MVESSHVHGIVQDSDRARLRELKKYRIDDLDDDQVLDSLTKLASRICGVPIAMVNFIGLNKQYTKSSFGWEIDEMNREDSFCTHTIQEKDWMIVPDATKDVRFQNSSAVLGDPNIRFYAGMNLKSNSGTNLGSLCVIDHKPRELTEEQKDSLEILAREVEARMELKHQNRVIKRKNRKLLNRARFLENSTDLMMLVDPSTYNIMEVNSGVEKVLGYAKKELEGQPLVSLSPRSNFFDKLNQWQYNNSNEKFECRVDLPVKNSGKVCFIILITEADGLWYLTARNIQRYVDAREEVAQTLKSLKNSQRIAEMGNWEWYPSEERMVWSDEIWRIFGLNPESGTPSRERLLEMVYEEDRQMICNNYKLIVGGGTVKPFEFRIVAADGAEKTLREVIEVDRDESGRAIKVTAICQDITAQKRTERKLLTALEDKEALIAEVHHRVKNNLALISGLMELELFKITGEAPDLATESLQSIISKIKSISLIHEDIYQYEEFAHVPFDRILEKLIAALASSIGVSNQFSFEYEISKTGININQAVPFSLALCELLESLLRSTLSDQAAATPTISFGLNSAGRRVALTIRIPKDHNPPVESDLLHVLLDQISGKLITKTPGEYRIEFRKMHVKGSSASSFYG
ncbi:MAG: PAS domain S-box protein [Balneolaceae bacterium]|nr:PAS domain S-box protein [Balneolaceae bacterium]